MRFGLALMVVLLAGPALADPWKDESGKGRWGYYESQNFESAWRVSRVHQ